MSNNRSILISLLIFISVSALLAMPFIFLPAESLSTYGKISILTLGVLVLLIAVKYFIPSLIGVSRPADVEDLKRFPFVSIIISVYNEEKVLPRTIEGLLALDYPQDRIEFIYVYEEKCTDHSEEIILSYARSAPRVKPLKRAMSPEDKVVANPKADSMNYGLEHARGEIVGFLDADHSLAKGAIQRAIYWLDKDEVACVRGRIRAINKEETFLAKLVGVERDIAECLSAYGNFLLGGFTHFPGGQGFFRREIFQKIGLFNHDMLVEDIDFSARVHENGYEIVVDPGISSWEEVPATLSSLWKQRMRWSLGWMQCAIKHFIPTFKSKMPRSKQLDIAFCWSSTFLTVITTFCIPMIIINAALLHGTSYFGPFLHTFGIFCGVTPSVTIGLILTCDYLEGESFRWDEILCMPIFLPYLIALSFISFSAFVVKFILRSRISFIKTPKSGYNELVETPVVCAKLE
jgi:cellulose synthase/poly-beta-1,6-N-acetylglucosamine synthase-like glycosyltransferase